MNNSFYNILTLSMSGTLLAIILIVLKPLFRHRLSKNWQYYIWLVVLLRLLLPYHPDISAIGIFDQTGMTVASDQTEIVEPTTPESQTESGQSNAQSLPAADMEVLPGEQTKVSSANPAMRTIQLASQYLWVPWILAAVVSLLYKILTYRKYLSYLRAANRSVTEEGLQRLYQKICADKKIKIPPPLYRNSYVATPMLAGVFRPFIVLPSVEDNCEKLGLILQHELIHYKRRDILYKWILQTVLCLYWFNPLIYLVRKEIDRLCELSCDETVMRGLKGVQKYKYGDILLDSVKPDVRYLDHIVSISLNEDAKLIKERLVAIVKYKRKSKFTVFFSVILTACIVCGAVVSGAQEPKKKSEAAAKKDGTSLETIKINTVELNSGAKISLGSQKIPKNITCKVSLKWSGSSKVKIICALKNGNSKVYTVKSGISMTFDVNKADTYTIAVKNAGDSTVKDIKGEITFSTKKEKKEKIAGENGTIVYDNVEIREYEDGSPYIHQIKTNRTARKVVASERGMLAYDKNGKPLKIHWYGPDSSAVNEYFFLFDEDEDKIAAGKTSDYYGGWSLNNEGKDKIVDEIAYILYCDKKITFEDGSVWTNPGFQKWLDTYKGKTIDTKILMSYYPYAQEIKSVKKK